MLVALAPLVANGLLGALGWGGSSGALPRNRILGVRTPRTLSSDEAWARAHQAAGPIWLWSGIGGALASVAAAAAGRPVPSTVLIAVSFAVGAVGLGVGAVRAMRA